MKKIIAIAIGIGIIVILAFVFLPSYLTGIKDGSVELEDARIFFKPYFQKPDESWINPYAAQESLLDLWNPWIPGEGDTQITNFGVSVKVYMDSVEQTINIDNSDCYTHFLIVHDGDDPDNPSADSCGVSGTPVSSGLSCRPSYPEWPLGTYWPIDYNIADGWTNDWEGACPLVSFQDCSWGSISGIIKIMSVHDEGVYDMYFYLKGTFSYKSNLDTDWKTFDVTGADALTIGPIECYYYPEDSIVILHG